MLEGWVHRNIQSDKALQGFRGLCHRLSTKPFKDLDGVVKDHLTLCKPSGTSEGWIKAHYTCTKLCRASEGLVRDDYTPTDHSEGLQVFVKYHQTPTKRFKDLESLEKCFYTLGKPPEVLQASVRDQYSPINPFIRDFSTVLG